LLSWSLVDARVSLVCVYFFRTQNTHVIVVSSPPTSCACLCLSHGFRKDCILFHPFFHLLRTMFVPAVPVFYSVLCMMDFFSYESRTREGCPFRPLRGALQSCSITNRHIHTSTPKERRFSSVSSLHFLPAARENKIH